MREIIRDFVPFDEIVYQNRAQEQQKSSIDPKHSILFALFLEMILQRENKRFFYLFKKAPFHSKQKAPGSHHKK